MDAFKPYCIGTAGYLAIQSLPLILSPRIIVSMAANEPRRITDLETYLCRSFGLTLLTLAAVLLPLTGLIPVTKTVTWADEPAEAEIEKRSKNPYAQPTLVTTTVYHALSAFYLYTQLTYNWNFAFTCGLIGSAVLFCFGMWVLLFGEGKGRLSKSTGADKRTGNYPFENKESSKEKKKDSKRRSVSKPKSRD